MQRQVLQHPLLFARDLSTQLRLMAHHPQLSAMPAGRKVGTTAREKRSADAVVQMQPGNPAATETIEHRHQRLTLAFSDTGQPYERGDSDDLNRDYHPVDHRLLSTTNFNE
ncbi:hypothetical protein ABB26_09915 [Stenotrophomonas humi]|uniref:Uncharacterized protein n=1 Tax=Stenotrophomonas humi TaxID=405444 RepID=A0A0R0CB25_9GAMM|nr:hypothetical protein ABB26_09915 [Stenotrophomonas humi]